jgi:hypothetical protein
MCTVNPIRHYIEFEEPQYDTQAVYKVLHENLKEAKIDAVAPMSPTLWLVTLLEPLKEPL